jgi:hypothetical protein
MNSDWMVINEDINKNMHDGFSIFFLLLSDFFGEVFVIIIIWWRVEKWRGRFLRG